MKKLVLSVALLLGLGLTQARAQAMEASANESQRKQGVAGRIIGDLKANTRTVHQINKENLAAEKEAFRTMHPELVKFREARGLRNKMQVIGENLREGCREASAKERERREEIRSFEAYRTLLDEQRKWRTDALNRVQENNRRG